MKIDVKGRNFAVTDEIRQKIEKRFEKVGKQVSELATLEIELSEEKNPSIRDKCVAEATLFLKGATLRAKDASESMSHRQPGGRRVGAPGHAAPRQAPPAARFSPCRTASC
jgi:putative sigma-54 modulation protein